MRLYLYAGFGLWALFWLMAVLLFPAFPVDETRYLTVAWEMHHSGNPLLLTLNGAPYSHKPPLLFWLINAVWSVTGLHAGAARIVPLAGMMIVFGLTALLARRLYPEKQNLPPVAALLWLSMPPVMIYGTLIMFDILMTVFVLTGLLALVMAVKDKHSWRPWIWLGLALGGGALTKGPVVLVYLGSVAAALPLARLCRDTDYSTVRWYGRLIVSLIIGTAIGLAWAVPAAIEGGPDYARMIFWGQSAGRMVSSFDHDRPFWFYLPLLPLAVLPWLAWPSAWRAVRVIRRPFDDLSFRFLVVAAGVPFIIFSLISGKQPHYLVPLLPPVAIMMAAILTRTFEDTRHLQKHLLLIIGVVAVMLSLTALYQKDKIFAQLDLQPLARAVQSYRDKPLAWVRKYAGEIGFYGRLTTPIESLERDQLEDWFAAHTDGYALVRYRDDSEIEGYDIVYRQPYKANKYIALIRPR